MPLMECRTGGKRGFKWGESGHCYPYDAGDERSKQAARRRALRQGRAIEANKRRSGAPVQEFSGEISDVLSVRELRGSYPDVPIAEGVNYEELIAGDADPVFLTIPIGQDGVLSGNKRYYDADFVQELARQTLAMRPIGLMGHLSPEERATAFPPEAIHWIGVAKVGDVLWGKGYVPPGENRDRIRRYKAQGKPLATSIDAFAEGKWDERLGAYRMQATGLRLKQIDIAPADRAGIPSLAHVPILTKEMGSAADGDGDEEQSVEESMNESERLQAIREMTLADVDLIPRDIREAIQEEVDVPPEVQQMEQVRAALGLDSKADVVSTVTEMRRVAAERLQSDIRGRVQEMAADKTKGIAAEHVRPLVVDMVLLRSPKSVQEAETLYGEIVASDSVKALVAGSVQEMLGPPQRIVRNGSESGKGGKFFKIPKLEDEEEGE